MSTIPASHGTTARPTPAARNYLPALIVLDLLFFAFGFITSLNDILVPHFKASFTLSYVQAMLIQLCFFSAYFVVSLPAGVIVEKVGYQRGIVLGLLAAGLGCLGFYPAAVLREYPLFLGALFVLASGIALLQVAANPYATALGPPETAASRLNLTQAFNSLGTTIGPLLGSHFILGLAGDHAGSSVDSVKGPYVGLAATLCLMAVVFSRLHLPQISADDGEDSADAVHGSLWRQRHLVLGVIGIFVYVGAEVSIGSFAVSYLGEPQIAGLAENVAGRYLAFYWGGALIGRFAGAWLLRTQKPGHVLAINGVIAALLLATSMVTAGQTAMWTVLSIGLFNSVMFPTIFTLAIARLGKRTGEGSGVLCMAIVGGALVPLAMGYFADSIGVQHAFIVPLLCYAYIIFYGLKGHEVVHAR